MRKFTAIREYFINHTYAVWYDEDGKPLGIKSIELPWKNNQARVSCIREKVYLCVPFKSPAKGEVYLLEDTGERMYIEIHSANFASELLGCIAPGLTFTKMLNKKTGKTEPAVTSSKAALKILKTLTDYQPFQLTIKNGIDHE